MTRIQSNAAEVIDLDDLPKTNNEKDIMNEYNDLNSKCDKILEKIKKRKSSQ